MPAGGHELMYLQVVRVAAGGLPVDLGGAPGSAEGRVESPGEGRGAVGDSAACPGGARAPAARSVCRCPLASPRRAAGVAVP